MESQLQKYCIFVKGNGLRCKARPSLKSEFCFFHNPAVPEERKLEVRSKAGKGQEIKPYRPEDNIKLPKSGKDLVKLLGGTLVQLREGNITKDLAGSTAYVASHLIKAIELMDYEKKVKVLWDLYLKKNNIQVEEGKEDEYENF